MPLCKARQQSSNASRMKQTGPSVRMPVCFIIYAVISAYFIQQYHLFAVSITSCCGCNVEERYHMVIPLVALAFTVLHSSDKTYQT